MEVLRSPYLKDIPRAFKINLPNGKEKLFGAYGRLIEHFAKYMSYTLELVDVADDVVMSQVQQKIEYNFYNISILTGSYKNRFANIDFSYPLERSITCVMVPAEDELPRFWYVVWPFDRYIWLFLAFFIMCVAVVMTCLKQPTNSYCNNMLHSMSLIIYSSNATLRLVNIPISLQLFYTLLFIVGFIMSSYYGSFLTVYNVKPLFQPYINTIEDALAANIKILISSNMLEEVQNHEHVNMLPLAKLLQVTDELVIADSMRLLNPTYAYAVSSTHWNIILKLQRNLIQPIYQLSNICFGPSFIAYPVQKISKFADPLNVFILLCQQSGLWEYWREEAFRMIVNHNMYGMPRDEYPVDPLAVSYYRIAWILYIGGVIVSSIGLALEMICYNYKLRITCIKKNNNKSAEV